MNEANATDLPPPESFQAIDRMLSEVTVPITVRYAGKVGPHATGLLFACGDYHFLVTARHAVADARDHNADLLVPSDSIPGTAVTLPGKFFLSSDPLLDVAVLPILADFHEHFQKHRWSHLFDFAASSPVPGVFCACRGILATESEVWEETDAHPVARLQPAIFVNVVTEPTVLPDGWVPAIHFAALGNITGTSTLAGTPRPAPSSIKGLSGSPVAVFTSNPFHPGFTPLPLRIAGFQSAVVPLNDGTGRRVTKVVHWGAMFGLIASVYPAVWDVAKHYGLTPTS